ncbi:hypothetical protein L1887_15398 [Cichorium endivia]|nr:hypothetical protein L1887_15398 [Cichorium endivia]
MLGEVVNANENPKLHLHLALTAPFVAGVLQASLGIFRLGFIVDFLSHATIVGFIYGRQIGDCGLITTTERIIGSQTLHSRHRSCLRVAIRLHSNPQVRSLNCISKTYSDRMKRTNTIDTAFDVDDEDFVNPMKGRHMIIEEKIVTPNIPPKTIEIKSTTYNMLVEDFQTRSRTYSELMKGTRSSSRFKENIKNKFSNTVDTALDVDDEDFVNPPKGAAVVTKGQPVQGVAKEKQSVTPNRYQDTILIESTTVKKRKARNVGSSSKVAENSVAKHVIEQMKEIRSKRKFETANFTKKTKRTTEKVKKIDKNHGKRSTEIVRKVDRSYGPGLRRLPSRMTPSRITMAVKTLSDIQKKAVEEMGFGAMLSLKMEYVPGLLNYYILDNYDPQHNMIVLENAVIEITPELVHKLLGLPIGGLDFFNIPNCEKDNIILQRWKAQYPGRKYSGEAYLKMIKHSEEDDKMFRLNFLTLFINTFIESMLMGTCQVKVLQRLVLIDNYAELAYVYQLTFSCISLTKRSPFVKYINGDDLEILENYEVANGGFGKAVEDKSVEDGEADERTESEDVNTIPNEFIGFEAYAAILEHAYDKILTEKNNMEVALQEGLAKNPDCPELLDWVEKKKELFNEESWKDGGVAEDSTERSPSHGSDSGDDEMGERELSPITGVITEGVGKNEDVCFKTPIGQTVNDIEGLTMTQFLEIPGVLDTVNKLVDDTVELSAEKQLKTKADAVRNLNDDLKEAIQQEVADKKGKRPVKIPKHLHSPFMQRIVKLDERIMPDELSEDSLFDDNELELNRSRDFGDYLRLYISNLPIQASFRDVGLDGEAFGKLDILQKTKLLQESEEASKRKRKRKGVQK